MSADQSLVDAAAIIEHVLHLGPRLHPFVRRIELAPQAVGGAVQIGKRVFEIVFRVGCLRFL